MHSGLLVFLWLVSVVWLQFLGTDGLAATLVASIVAAGLLAPVRSRRLVKRVRFILMAIVILFAGFTPGEAVLSAWPVLSPSREGVLLAFEHAARVVVVVLFVAMLMERLPPSRLVSALYALLRPFEVVGVPADRVAVRTLLVLRFVEAEKPPRWDHWIRDDSNDLHERIDVGRESFGVVDVAVAVVGIGLAVTWWVWAW